MELQKLNRDDNAYGQYCDLEESVVFTGKIVLTKYIGGYHVSQSQLFDLENSWSPFSSFVKLEPIHPKSNSNMEIYEQQSGCISQNSSQMCKYLCVCIGSAILGALVSKIQTSM